ncbi:hypothetical protein ACS0TY_011849 [Phlomoides rotata]
MEKHEDKCRYSPSQMEALTALCDTLLPSIHVSDQQKHHLDDSVIHFFQASASVTGTPQRLAVVLTEKTQHPMIFLSGLGLWALSTWIGTFIVCGRKSLSTNFPYFQRFSRISPQNRRLILLSWSASSIFFLRLLFSALKVFTLLVFFTQVNEKDENLSWKAIGYRRPDPKAIDGDENTEQSGPLCNGIIELNRSKDVALNKLQRLGFPVSKPISKKSKIKSLNPSFIIKCDAVVVGSGSGGGVVAGVLAEAGYKVLVLEKGSYVARNDLSLLEGKTLDEMYLGHGVLGTRYMDILMLAGSTVGGGSTINWSASIRTPPHVVKEWSQNHKLELFGSEKYQKALDIVCKKMGVQSEFEHEGFNNMILRKGCEELGYPVETIPRNAASDHDCGFCCLGCRDGKKKGTSETWLVDLIESGNGVILPECEAIKVMINEKDGRTAAGVAFTFENDHGQRETAIVESKVTVVACGALSTPPLLKTSGLKNPNIGKHLHLHPVVMAWGYFPADSWPEAEKKSYEGAIMTAMSRIVSNSEESGYGAIIQTPSLHPGIFSALMPWRSGTDIKNRLCKFSRTAHIFALARDRGSGTVNATNDISYRVEDSEEENLSKGMEKALRILAGAGAEEIGTHHREGRVLNVKESSREELEKFVKEESSRPLKYLENPVCSAHQMGSCRMGVDPKSSAVNPMGECWEVEGLFVADSSVFPTALGVNPMVTVQATAYCTAQSLVQFLAKNK